MMKMIKSIITLFLLLTLCTNAIGEVCLPPKPNQDLTLLCRNVDDILCAQIPKSERRGCEVRDQRVFKKDMTAQEVYEFARRCFQSAVTSFTQFFTEFIPELIKGIWNATTSAADGSLWDKIKGEYESVKSIAADIHEAVRENPSAYFNHIWEKIVAATSEKIQNFDCLKPELKVERTCGFVAGWLMPPAILAKVLVKGIKAVKLKRAENVASVGAKEINLYKSRFQMEPKLPPGSNQKFMDLMKADAALKNRVLYFDVENAVQKKLNDIVLRDKGLVDAVNNSYMQKLLDNLKANPELMARIEGQYKDYKSLRLRLVLKEGDDPAKFQKMLADLQLKTGNDFKAEFEKVGMNKSIPPITDEAADPGRWFLAGTGNSALEANMAARGARANPNASVLDYKSHAPKLDRDIRDIEKLRQSLAGQKDLQKNGVLTTTTEGIIPSKEMIEILRKNKPEGFSTPDEYLAKIKSKTKTMFGKELDDKTIADLTNYFQKVDSLSPPLFTPERTLFNLDDAKKGIVSIDFAGAGVNNAYEQMRALASSTGKNTSDTLNKVQSHVDSVTKQMDDGKTIFDSSVKQTTRSSNSPQFSGDDGIFMPKTELTANDKNNLIKKMGEQKNPSQYRVTFVKSEYDNGKTIPAKERSKRIAEAESVEKKLRELITGKNLITPGKSKEMMFAIDYSPKEYGGTFDLIIGGKKPSPDEMKIINEAFTKALNSSAGEMPGAIRTP